jgi:hypothetical protein
MERAEFEKTIQHDTGSGRDPVNPGVCPGLCFRGSPVRELTQYLLTGGNGYTMFEDAEILTDMTLADNEVVVKYKETN